MDIARAATPLPIAEIAARLDIPVDGIEPYGRLKAKVPLSVLAGMPERPQGRPVCVAKTQYSFATDKALRGAPSGHVVDVREVRLSAGAGFVVMICGSITTMPGLPAVPAASTIDVTDEGQIVGLF